MWPRGHSLAAGRGQVGARYILGDRNLTLEADCSRSFPASAAAPCPACACPMLLPIPRLAGGLAGSAPAAPRAAHSPWRACAWLGTRCLWRAPRPNANWGFNPASLEAALDRAIRWYSDNGYVKTALKGPHRSENAQPEPSCCWADLEVGVFREYPACWPRGQRDNASSTR
jgi:dihydroflavonol-4-reductase